MRASPLRFFGAGTVFLLVVATRAAAGAPGDLLWAKNNWPPGSRATAPLPDGSFVATATFSGSLVLGAAEPNETLLVSGGLGDIVVARYNADGTLAWARRAGGTDLDAGAGVASFADGSAVVTGSFRGTATFGAAGVPSTTLVASSGSEDVFVARYDADGALAWAKRAGGPGADSGSSIASYADGSSVVTGLFNGSATFGPGEPGARTLAVPTGPSLGVPRGHDLFVARYNADGTLAWAQRAGGTEFDLGLVIASFADGSSGVGGVLLETGLGGAKLVVFGPGAPDRTTFTANVESAEADLHDAQGHMDHLNRKLGYANDRKDRLAAGEMSPMEKMVGGVSTPEGAAADIASAHADIDKFQPTVDAAKKAVEDAKDALEKARAAARRARMDWLACMRDRHER